MHKAFDGKRPLATLRKISKASEIIPALFAILQRTVRYDPRVQWSDKSWVHNIFRFYELIFWRKFGIRPESSVSTFRENGKLKTSIAFHSWESVFAYCESWIRGLVPRMIPERVFIPVFQTSGGIFRPPGLENYLFAIAIDTSVNGGSVAPGTSLTWSHTCTGSNLLLSVGLWVDSTATDVVTGITYNSVAMTRANRATIDIFNQVLYYLVAPDTGAHNVVGSFSSSSVVGGSASYSGCAQTGQPDAQNTNTAAVGSTSITTTVTVVTNNSWLTGQYGNNGGTTTAGAGTFQRQTEGSTNRCIYDSNAAVGTGSQSLIVNVASSPQNSILNIMAIAPVSTDININLSDSVTVAESVTMMEDLNPDVNDAVTVAEAITTGGVDLGDISVFDSVTVSESVAIDFPFDISVFDSVAVSESVTVENTSLGDINVNDAVTISESVTVTVSAAKRGMVVMRSNQQSYPIPMDDTRQL